MEVATLPRQGPPNDPVAWTLIDTFDRCSRCGAAPERLIAPYWSRARPICPACCLELNQLFDVYGWPDEG